MPGCKLNGAWDRLGHGVETLPRWARNTPGEEDTRTRSPAERSGPEQADVVATFSQDSGHMLSARMQRNISTEMWTEMLRGVNAKVVSSVFLV